MEFQKNSFYKNNPTKIAGGKVFTHNNPLERSAHFLKQTKRELPKAEPMTPEKRLEEQKNQRHFLGKWNSFQNK